MMPMKLIYAAGLTALAATWALAADEKPSEDDVEAGTIGTGIMGEITGRSSIHIGGVRIVVPDDLNVQSRLGVRPASELQIGETVVVSALEEDGALTAHRIQSYHPLVAPIDDIEAERMQILGLELDISDIDTPNLAVGDWVAVNGLWRGNTVAVSSLRRVAPRADIVINATFAEGLDGGQMVGPFPLQTPIITNAETGDHLRVSGTWSAATGALSARQIETGLFSSDLRTLLVEGYMSEPDENGTYFIFGSGIVFYSNGSAMDIPTERSVFCVDLSNNPSFTQEIPLELPRDARVSLLERIQAGQDRMPAPRCGH